MPRLLLHTLLALATGVLSGAVIIAFRLGVETVQARLLPGGPGAYEALPPALRPLPLLASALLLAWLFSRLGPERSHVGIPHVMERLARDGARLPATNAVVQFVAGTVAIAGGHSVDREGPGVHLGAATGSLLAGRAALHYTGRRLMSAAGAAAAIAAAFNTPLAGVAFAIEVFLRRLTLASFLPVIVAAVAAATLSRTVFGPEPAFTIPPLPPAGGGHMPLAVALGLGLGAAATAFIALTGAVHRRTAPWPVGRRFLCAAAGTALVAWPVPEVMGVSYDTMERILAGDLAPATLVAVFAGKLLATAVAVGFGIPGGLIGPTLLIGGAAGGIAGILAGEFLADQGHAVTYALVGMGTMMGATLGAPLAAVTALLELTLAPAITLPLLGALVPAHLVVVLALGRRSVFEVLRAARVGTGRS